MKYLCTDCGRLHAWRLDAEECCRPRVEPVDEAGVMPCSRGGDGCTDEACASCRGTGWQFKGPEASRDQAAEGA